MILILLAEIVLSVFGGVTILSLGIIVWFLLTVAIIWIIQYYLSDGNKGITS